MADLFGFGKGFGAESIAQQQRALEAQQQALQSPAVAKRGGQFVAALGQRHAESRRRANEEARARLILSGQTEAIEQMGAHGPVDRSLADVEGMLIASRRAAEQGNASLALELHQMARQMEEARQNRLLEQDVLRSEAGENRAQAAAQGQGTPSEIVRNQRAIDDLMRRAQNTTNDASRKLYLERIDTLRERNQTLATNTQTINEVTQRTQGDMEGTLLSASDNLIRLHEARANYDEQLLQFGPRIDLAVAALADKMGNATPDQRNALLAWNAMAQPAYDVVNQTLHELSGAAVTAQELKRQRQNLPNPGTASNPFSGDGPSLFRSKLDNQIRWSQAAVDRYTFLLDQGILSPGQKITEDMSAEYPVADYMLSAAPAATTQPEGRFQ